MTPINKEYEQFLLERRKQLQEQIQDINVELANIGIKKLQNIEKRYQENILKKQA